MSKLLDPKIKSPKSIGTWWLPVVDSFSLLGCNQCSPAIGTNHLTTLKGKETLLIRPKSTKKQRNTAGNQISNRVTKWTSSGCLGLSLNESSGFSPFVRQRTRGSQLFICEKGRTRSSGSNLIAHHESERLDSMPQTKTKPKLKKKPSHHIISFSRDTLVGFV